MNLSYNKCKEKFVNYITVVHNNKEMKPLLCECWTAE